MRRLALLAFGLTAMLTPMVAHAQMGGGGADEEQAQEDAKKKRRDAEWNNSQAPLPAMRNAGPCPYVKSLYDAARYVEFNGREASADVGFTGEIQGVSAGCHYKGAEPIKVEMEILFELGKGPKAEGGNKTYRYWVAVTDRNRSVITRSVFDLPVKFTPGQDRVLVTEKIGNITIPRAKDTTSGANFEILVGFEVTPEMAAFNREGKRFRANAGNAAVAATQ